MPPVFVCGPDTQPLASAKAEMAAIKSNLVRIELILPLSVNDKSCN
jgi:hypothetical protein